MTNFDNPLILENISQEFKSECFLCIAENCDFSVRKKNGPGYTKGYLLMFFDSIIPGSIDALGDNYSQWLKF